MAKEKPDTKPTDKARSRSAAPIPRQLTFTLPDGTTTTRIIGPVPKLRAGGVRKRKKTKYAWNSRPRKSKMGSFKKTGLKSHYEGLSDEKKKAIKPMTFMDFPGEVRNIIYPTLLDEIDGRSLIFSNNTTGLVPGWPTTIVPRIPIGLLSGNKEIRQELLPLAYDKTDIHIRILSAHLNSPNELYAWVDANDAIPFSCMDVTLIPKLSLTIFLPCAFETIHPGQGIDFAFLTRMEKLRVLRVRVQVHVPNPHLPPWTTFDAPVPTSTFTPFVSRIMNELFRHVPRATVVDFGDGVAREDGGLGSWVDERADGRSDMGWMENPVLAGSLGPETEARERDTVAVPIHQAEAVWGALRSVQGSVGAGT
ncbi:hypothetical protein FKW77_001450 [Venturia effusa]|uniref:Uncharacterized protein n=1 Tax=Venturia effusa TaxID=50376 RepID=A0A517LPS7_9PEZI|nr:hypothetical protein FKW77_001450 [Venturia effusa]